VLGVLHGVCGRPQPNASGKLLLGIGSPLIGRLLQYDALELRFHEFKLTRDSACRACSRPQSEIVLSDEPTTCAAT
jgi:molybdopterin/thiamine biosynthesis adenylyltransferase